MISNTKKEKSKTEDFANVWNFYIIIILCENVIYVRTN